ncbi:hypothetical protein [Nocardia bovistercoris]|uniref:Uncharacterized protein n=1 Tax=Nocardia bovistercoris TaxID=2785916 RepID=A0A931I7X2_9NOCA|nr:hypothetical protein [Nocardia bovistercoris]MBH0776577.1 hypothetical protein [Nocardia bovistercoris]
MSILHQIGFGPRPGRGVGVLADSLGDPVAVARYEAALERHLRLKQYGTTAPPPTALSFFRFGPGESAVLHRSTASGAMGRNHSHALIGDLPVSIAVGIGAGPWSFHTPTYLPLADADEVLRAAADRLPDVRRAAIAELGLCAEVLAALLSDPAAPLSVVGCPEPVKLPVLLALHEAAGSYLADNGVERAWTFSTYEIEHSGRAPHTPEIIFLPGPPEGDPMVAARTIVDLRETGRADAHHARTARQLLDEWAGGGVSHRPEPPSPRVTVAPPPTPVPPTPVPPTPAPVLPTRKPSAPLPTRSRSNTPSPVGNTRSQRLLIGAAAGLALIVVAAVVVLRSAPEPRPPTSATSPVATTAATSSADTTADADEFVFDVGSIAPRGALIVPLHPANGTGIHRRLEGCGHDRDKVVWHCSLPPGASALVGVLLEGVDPEQQEFAAGDFSVLLQVERK